MPESSVLALAGVLGMPIIQLLKNVLGLSGAKMLWASYLVSFVIMVITAIITRSFGDGVSAIFADPDAFLKAGAMVFTATSLFYGSIKEHTSGLSGD